MCTFFSLGADKYSSVSSAVVQRYLTHILDSALSRNPQVQAVAVEILSFTVKQGLAHPLQVCHKTCYLFLLY